MVLSSPDIILNYLLLETKFYHSGPLVELWDHLHFFFQVTLGNNRKEIGIIIYILNVKM